MRRPKVLEMIEAHIATLHISKYAFEAIDHWAIQAAWPDQMA